jgi:uncharacterized protein (TIRG00374 family)
MKRSLGIIFGIVCSGVFLYLALRGVDLAVTWRYMRGADFKWVASIVASTLIADVVRAVRWRHLLKPVKHVSLASLFRSVMIGEAGNQVLPLRLGEALRAYSLKRNEAISFTTVLTTQVVERILDVIGVLMFLGVCLAVLPVPDDLDPRVNLAVRVLSAGVGILVVCGGFVLFKRRLATSWLDRLLLKLPAGPGRKITPLVQKLLAGLRSLGSGRQIGILLADTILLWICFGGAFAFGLQSLGLAGDSGLALLAPAILVLVCVALFTMMPAAIGSVGTYQAGCIVALAVFGIAKDQALGFSVIVYSTQFVTAVTVGFLYFAAGVGSIAELRRLR